MPAVAVEPQKPFTTRNLLTTWSSQVEILIAIAVLPCPAAFIVGAREAEKNQP